MPPKFVDKYEAFQRRIKPPLVAADRTEIAKRPVPRFLHVERMEEGVGFSITIPTARRTWWTVGILVIFAVVTAGPPFVATQSVFGNTWTGRGYSELYFSWPAFLTYLAILAALVWAVWWVCFPRIRITADHEGITVHNRLYPWHTARGFRMGYSLGGVERSDKQGPFIGLRVAYGPWGDDLPYLVSQYHAPAYVMFLNEALQQVEPNSDTDKKTEAGVKPVLF